MANRGLGYFRRLNRELNPSNRKLRGYEVRAAASSHDRQVHLFRREIRVYKPNRRDQSYRKIGLLWGRIGRDHCFRDFVSLTYLFAIWIMEGMISRYLAA
jgi:hypothetical protein